MSDLQLQQGAKIGFMEFNNFDQAQKWAKVLSESDFVPHSFKGKVANILIAVQFGYELGLQPLQALQNIAVINGKPSLWGDAMLAICQSKPDVEEIREWMEKDAKGIMTAYCAVKIKNHAEHVISFSSEQAKKAGLWGKAGPWTNYPERMLQMRARGFALRDKCSHHLKGLIAAEEAQDYDVKSLKVVKSVEPIKPEPVLIDEPLVSEESLSVLESIIKAGQISEDKMVSIRNHAKVESNDKLKEKTVVAIIDKALREKGEANEMHA